MSRTDRTIRVGLLGAGRIGRTHAQAIAASPGVKLAAVADPIAAAAESLAATTGAAVAPVDAIVDDPSIDAVLICTPTDTHATLIERSARAGKAIFCEKPVALDVARARECLAVVKQTKALLMLGFNRRFDPNFAEVRRRVAAGDVGDVEMVAITSRDPAPPPVDYIRHSGGLFKDMMIHDFDMARFLLGEEPATVTAMASVLVDKAIGKARDVDSANVILRTRSGKLASIANSRRATYGYDQRIEVHGSAGLASAENTRPTTVEVATGEGYRREPLHAFFMERYAASYTAEITAFAQAVSSGARAVSPNGDDGVRALVLAEAAQRSHREGRTVDVKEITG